MKASPINVQPSEVSLAPENEEFVDEYATFKHPVPCLFLPNKSSEPTSKIVIYFHGNAEDVGLASEMLDYIRYMMHVHILAVEYPGYGIYDGSPNAE